MNADAKALSIDLLKSKALRIVETNPTLTAQQVNRLTKDLMGWAEANAKTKKVILVAFTKP